MKTTFIYALKELAPGEFFSTKIRYIGKADDPYGRFQEHCCTKEKCHRGSWIRSLAKEGLALQLEILDEVPDLEWEYWEREYIRVFRAIGFNLVNGTDGGDGVKNPTAAVRAKQRAAKLNKPRPEEVKKKISKTLTGRKLSPEHCENMQVHMTGKKLGPRTENWHNSLEKLNWRKSQSASKLGKKSSRNASGFVGVSWNRNRAKWRSEFTILGKRIVVGRFKTLEDAVFARALAMDVYGTRL